MAGLCHSNSAHCNVKVAVDNTYMNDHAQNKLVFMNVKLNFM